MPVAGAGRASPVRRAAIFNVAGAVVLIAVKLATGIATGSLGFLAEAAHSATDLVAALMTLFAVKVALRPPDQEHQYGHGKAEHLAALGESAALLLVSVAIGYESLSRLIGGDAGDVEAEWWAFAVLAGVICVDLARATSSRRTAQRHNSPALAAGALHFTSDMAGSLALFVGLIFVASGTPEGDAVAALFVAVLVVFAAVRLANRSVQVLMDRASAEADAQIRAALDGVDGVELKRMRVRQAGASNFVDMVVGVSPDAAISLAHEAADEIERRVEAALGNADVVVHIEPLIEEGDLRERATAAAAKVAQAREIHNVRILRVNGGYELSLHVKLPRSMSLTDAHQAVEQLEQAVLADVPEVRSVHTHFEPLSRTRSASAPEAEKIAGDRSAIEQATLQITGTAPLSVDFRDSGRGRIARVTIAAPGDVPLPTAHQLAGEVEAEIFRRCPDLREVIVHTEPAG